MAEPIEVYVNMFQDPKAWEDETGMHGYMVESAEAIFMDANIDYVWAAVPFSRAMAEVKACKGLMVGVFMSPARKEYLSYSAPIISDEVGMVTRASDRFAFSSMADLKGLRISYLSAGIFGINETDLQFSILDPQLKSDVMLKKLIAGRTDIVILSPREQIPIAARQAGVAMEKLRVEQRVVATLNNHIVACKKDDRYGPILRRIDQSIGKLKAAGEFDRIKKVYGKP
jgi:ABC-type amino acid transport substrate-binding protein